MLNHNELVLVLLGPLAIECIAIGLFFLFNRNKSHGGNKYLGFYLMIRGVNFTNVILYLIKPEWSSAFIAYSSLGLFGPLLLLYLLETLGFKRAMKWYHYSILFAPFLYACAWMSIITDTLGYETILGNGLNLPINITYIIYLVFSLFLIYSTQKSAKQKGLHSNGKFLLLKFLVLLILIQTLTYLISAWLFDIQKFDIAETMLITYFITIIIQINGLIFIGLKYPESISGVSFLRERIKSNHEDKYQYSDLTQSEASLILMKLENYLTKQNMFKDANLTLEFISNEIGNESRDVSQSINQYKRQNFNEYINDFRIRHATRLLNDPQKSDLRINEIMYEVGFNSKSSFHKLFKRKTGMTPKEYRSRMT